MRIILGRDGLQDGCIVVWRRPVSRRATDLQEYDRDKKKFEEVAFHG
jgi:hypothetical protein